MSRTSSRGLAHALVLAFADGRPHTLAEAMEVACAVIPATIALRVKARQLAGGGRAELPPDAPLGSLIASGQRQMVAVALRKLGATPLGTGVFDKWRRFVLAEGTYGPPTGVAARWSKLTPERVREARRRIAAGESGKALALEFGVAKSTLWHAIHGDTWRSAT